MKRLLKAALWLVLALVVLAAGTLGWIEYRRPRLRSGTPCRGRCATRS